MKICITSAGENLDSSFDSRFGRCQFFIIIDTDTMKYKSILNDGNISPHGAGIAAAQQVVNAEVDVVITGNVGPNSFNVLTESGIKIYKGQHNIIKDNIDLFNEGKLELITKAGKSHGGI